MLNFDSNDSMMHATPPDMLKLPTNQGKVITKTSPAIMFCLRLWVYTLKQAETAGMELIVSGIEGVKKHIHFSPR